MNSTDDAPRGALRHGETTEKIIGAFYDVYNELGFGFLESVYHKSMLLALTDAGLRVETQVHLPSFFAVTSSAISSPISLWNTP